ncbi:PKD-like domain-containing protein [Psychroflexus aestuariivivens]|uniref:PKD-like domain-containing protein n=1 Tax=Psychroflexus aestuariivivens TaxID=1795040 RepID=UPI000FDB376C|nr:PKD-like domain-containing protein [Psychroflexus aestuariivivens]
MAQLNLKFYMIAFLCFAGITAGAQESGTQEICIGDVKTYSVNENSDSSFSWEIEESAFAGIINENTASGNEIEIDWQNTPAGAYTLTVIETNSEGCPGAPVTATINVNPLPDAPVVTLTQPGCGELTGSMEITSPLGADLQYSIDGGSNFQDSVNFEDLDPDVYNVIAQNGSGCLSEPTEFEINEPLVIPETPVVEVTHPECGETTGGLEITSPTGTGLEYSIDGGTTFSSDLTFADLEPGQYNVIATNGDCDSETVTVTIDPAPVVPENPEFTIVDPDCGEDEGTLTITAPLGAELEYSADGGTTWQTDLEFVLEAGTHQIQVRNTGSTCTSEVVDATIEEAPEIPTTSPIQFN